MKAVDEAIMALMGNDQPLKPRFDILVSVPGLSRITAFALLIEMPELGELDKKATAASCGLAPMNRQSGRWTEHALITSGRAIASQALYIPALVAYRFNPAFKTKCEQLKAAGKAPKVAITTIMRKLILLANAPCGKTKNGHQKNR